MRLLLIVALATVSGLLPLTPTNHAHAQGIGDGQPIDVDGPGDCFVYVGITICGTPIYWPRWSSSNVLIPPNITDPIEPDIQSLTDLGLYSEDTGTQSSTDPANQGSMICGNPFNVLSGNKVQHEYDYVGTGRFPLTLCPAHDARDPAREEMVDGCAATR